MPLLRSETTYTRAPEPVRRCDRYGVSLHLLSTQSCRPALHGDSRTLQSMLVLWRHGQCDQPNTAYGELEPLVCAPGKGARRREGRDIRGVDQRWQVRFGHANRDEPAARLDLGERRCRGTM